MSSGKRTSADAATGNPKTHPSSSLHNIFCIFTAKTKQQKKRKAASKARSLGESLKEAELRKSLQTDGDFWLETVDCTPLPTSLPPRTPPGPQPWELTHTHTHRAKHIKPKHALEMRQNKLMCDVNRRPAVKKQYLTWPTTKYESYMATKVEKLKMQQIYCQWITKDLGNQQYK